MRGRIMGFTLGTLLTLASNGMAKSKTQSLCDLHYPSDERIEYQCRKLKWTDTPSKLFGEHWQDVLRFNRMDRRHFVGGMSIKVPKQLDQIVEFTPMPLTYPDAAKEKKFILVDQTEMFLGAYEFGELVLSFPIAVGVEGHRVPNGNFRIDVADRLHESNMYKIEEMGRPYPMHYALRFFENRAVDGWPSSWIHGRDVPGYPASHGCIGLYDEEMQYDYYDEHDRKVNKPYYHEITRPYLQGAQVLYNWVVGTDSDPGTAHTIKSGPRVLIIGQPPL